MEVYIVVRQVKVENNLYYTLNEAVFDTEAKANEYAKKRNRSKNPKDADCNFDVEPWFVG